MKLTPILIFVILIVTACSTKPQEIDLPFETVEQRDWVDSESYEAQTPGLKVISQADEVESVDGVVTEEACRKLIDLDYDKYFALVAFQGWKPYTGYSVQVNRISHIGDIVNIYSQLTEPKSDLERNPEASSPYVIVRVRKISNWDQNIRFDLIAGGEIIATINHYVP